jgi:head-tail adaptor
VISTLTKVSLKMKNKEMSKETFVRFYREEISRAKLHFIKYRQKVTIDARVHFYKKWLKIKNFRVS